MCANIKTFLHVSDQYVCLWQIYQLNCSKLPLRLSYCAARPLPLSLFHFIKHECGPWPQCWTQSPPCNFWASCASAPSSLHCRCPAPLLFFGYATRLFFSLKIYLWCSFFLFCQPFGSNVIWINSIFFLHTSYSPPTKQRIVSISVYYSHIFFNLTFSDVLPWHNFSFYIAFIIYLKRDGNFFNIIPHLAFFGSSSSSSSSSEEEVQQSNQKLGECSKLMLLRYSVTWYHMTVHSS